MPRRRYPSDTTDAERAVLGPHVPAPKAGGRPPTHERREIVDLVGTAGAETRAVPDGRARGQVALELFFFAGCNPAAGPPAVEGATPTPTPAPPPTPTPLPNVRVVPEPTPPERP